MARRKNKNVINIKESRKFLHEVFGLKSTEVDPYQIMVIHEELRGKFLWYHTSGKVVILLKGIGDESATLLPVKRKLLDDESLANFIQEFVFKALKDEPGLYWDRSQAREHKEAMKRLQTKVQHT